MKVGVSVDVQAALKSLDLANVQVRRAAATAMTRTAVAIKAAQIEEMKRALDRPTPYALGGLFVSPAKARQNVLEAQVFVKDNVSGKGNPANKFLSPQVDGGDRRPKRFERALYLAGILPNGMFAVPGGGAQLDAYGNMRAAEIVKILSYFQAFPDVGSRKNSTEKTRARLAKGNAKKGISGIAYFVLRSPRGKLPAGVYKRTVGAGVTPMLIFVDQPNYERKWQFYPVAARVASARFGIEYTRAFAEGLARQNASR
jgi:hypothetical protein